jgi:MoaA/NifB/PqqE/SkfB family radical SAM enzyme
MTFDSILERLQGQFQILSVIDCDVLSEVDLYIKINQLRQDRFPDDARIVFVITKDQYKDDGPGLRLQQLQAMLNSVDISNFFAVLLTTNADVYKEYAQVLSEISTDPVPLHVYHCVGPYHRQQSQRQLVLRKYSELKQSVGDISRLDPQQRDTLFGDSSFCLMPWIGIHIAANNQVKPCCESTLSLGNSAVQSLDEIWNSAPMRDLRKAMMAGAPVPSCDACHVKERLNRQSLRQSTNQRFARHVHRSELTDDTGTLSSFDLVYWDIRYNNLCNLACRSCNPEASSSWHKAAVYLNNASDTSALRVAGRSANDMYDQIMQHTASVESIYFAGGEPLIIEEFYQVLQALIDQGRTDVQLIYNTNFTRTRLKSSSIFDLWNHFERVSVGASLDAELERGEYIRQGTVWQDVLENRAAMITQCPHVDFYISATASLLNVLHLPTFHRSWVQQGLIEPSDFNIQLLFEPEWLRVDSAPRQIKNQIREVYAEHLAWLTANDRVGRSIYGFRSILDHIEHAREFQAAEFWHNINALDLLYDRDFSKTFPELDLLPRS